MAPEIESLRFLVDDSAAGARLDSFLASRIDGWSRSRLQQLIDGEDVLVNDAKAKSSYKIHVNDEIEVELTELPVTKFEPEDIPLDIVFEDEHLAVINKPAGMVVHPGAGIQSGTLANAIAFHFRSEPLASAGGQKDELEGANWPPAHAGGSDRIGIVHRLDKDTSGLIVVAKSDEIHEALSEQFRERQVYKSYVALVHGATDKNSDTIEAPIGRNKHNRLRMKVATHGRSAVSIWKVRRRFTKFTILDVEIKTGRTHQIRVHMAYINHPIVGDEIYNEGRDNTIADSDVKNAIHSMGRFFLHAARLTFTHPKTGEKKEFVQPLPSELEDFLKIL
ncbi:RluA family pseudouridine synthase [soil metagenome]